MKAQRLAVLFAISFACIGVRAAMADWVTNLFFGPPVNYGSWYCSACIGAIPKPGDPASSQAIPEVGEFIHAANNDIHSGERVHRTIPNSSITVCDGSYCLTVYYQADTDLWLPRGPAKQDPGKYKNTGPVPNITPSNASNITITFQGPAPSPSGVFTVYISPNSAGNTVYQSIPAYQFTIVSGPLVPVAVTGPTSDFSTAFQNNLYGQINPYSPGEAVGLNSGQGGTVVCGYSGCRNLNEF